MSPHGTRFLEARSSSGGSTSGIRLRKNKLAAPMMALKAKRTLNCQACGPLARQAAASKKQPKLARFTHPASRARYLPRTAAGTSEVIQGSQAQLEMPRERLKAKRKRSSNAKRLVAFKKAYV